MSKEISDAEYPSHIYEAQHSVRIEFFCQCPVGTITIHSAECGLDITILGLKINLQNVFHLQPENQSWYLRSTLLNDKDTLASYGIVGTERTSEDAVKILVKQA
ncbi:hypothetical protein BgiMline_018799 [Biomphalaria glabrata]|nr:hypothetical protein BgiMline_006393 [Biomphalaria glabrata]KAI8791250.1 hypothetical protein BgiBS90_006714 [Biomphalaria glabrata]